MSWLSLARSLRLGGRGRGTAGAGCSLQAKAGAAAARQGRAGQGRSCCSPPLQRPFSRWISNQGPEIMAGKPKLYYFNGRGRMESIRWLLGAAGVEFEEEFVETRDQYDKLLQDELLLFQQIPMVEMDGMKMVQSRAILNYIATKHNLCGKNMKEKALIDMYVDGVIDLMRMILMYPFVVPEEQEKQVALIVDRAKNRYFPVYEKVLKDHGQNYLVGNQLSWADVAVLEAILAIEEKSSDVLPAFPLLQSFKERISNLPTIKKFLGPGGQRKPVSDKDYADTVRSVFYKYKDVKLKAGVPL